MVSADGTVVYDDICGARRINSVFFGYLSPKYLPHAQRATAFHYPELNSINILSHRFQCKIKPHLLDFKASFVSTFFLSFSLALHRSISINIHISHSDWGLLGKQEKLVNVVELRGWSAQESNRVGGRFIWMCLSRRSRDYVMGYWTADHRCGPHWSMLLMNPCINKRGKS